MFEPEGELHRTAFSLQVLLPPSAAPAPCAGIQLHLHRDDDRHTERTDLGLLFCFRSLLAVKDRKRTWYKTHRREREGENPAYKEHNLAGAMGGGKGEVLYKTTVTGREKCIKYPSLSGDKSTKVGHGFIPSFHSRRGLYSGGEQQVQQLRKLLQHAPLPPTSHWTIN